MTICSLEPRLVIKQVDKSQISTVRLDEADVSSVSPPI